MKMKIGLLKKKRIWNEKVIIILNHYILVKSKNIHVNKSTILVLRNIGIERGKFSTVGKGNM